MPFDSMSPGADKNRGGAAHWLLLAIYVVCGAAFIDDIQRVGSLAYGIVYVLLVAGALLHRHTWGLRAVTAIAVGLVLIGGAMPVMDTGLPDQVGNRLLSIVVILVTAALVRHARMSQHRLAAATRRAEAAEQMKAEVLDNLSRELRTPLHTLLGVLRLMMLDCRPDQKPALRRVEAGGRQLLSTIDNLVDLTQLDPKALRRQPVPVATILRDAADNARCLAEEHGVTIEVETAGTEAHAVGDIWATRRILDNLIADAVRLSRVGGVVSLAVDQAAGQVAATVRDSGAGASDHTQGDPSLPGDAAPGEMVPGEVATTDMDAVSHALSHHLAQAMDGSLLRQGDVGAGTSVSLRLPAALKAAA